MELAPDTFEELARVIHRISGLVVGTEKSYLVRHRLEPLVKSAGCESFDGLLRELKSIGGHRLHDAVIEAITTKETSFFRDAWFFDALCEHVLPQCGAAHRMSDAGHGRLRIWSAAASTGQEPYSLAMLARELSENHNFTVPQRQVSILATDISAEALATAKSGLYSSADVKRGISEQRLGQCFQRMQSRWQIDPILRQRIIFRRLDLLHLPADLGTFDLILCRNVLIYFDQRAREKVCSALYSHLEPGGWLGLGSAESLYGVNDRFDMVKFGRAVLYRKPLKSR